MPGIGQPDAKNVLLPSAADFERAGNSIAEILEVTDVAEDGTVSIPTGLTITARGWPQLYSGVTDAGDFGSHAPVPGADPVDISLTSIDPAKGTMLMSIPASQPAGIAWGSREDGSAAWPAAPNAVDEVPGLLVMFRVGSGAAPALSLQQQGLHILYRWGDEGQ